MIKMELKDVKKGRCFGFFKLKDEFGCGECNHKYECERRKFLKDKRVDDVRYYEHDNYIPPFNY